MQPFVNVGQPLLRSGSSLILKTSTSWSPCKNQPRLQNGAFLFPEPSEVSSHQASHDHADMRGELWETYLAMGKLVPSSGRRNAA